MKPTSSFASVLFQNYCKYLSEVSRVREGANEGAWLTTNISVPVDAGQAL